MQKNLPLFTEDRLSSCYVITSSVILCWKNRWKIKTLWQGECQIKQRKHCWHVQMMQILYAATWCPATTSFTHQEMLNSYQGELGASHLQEQHCPTTAKIAKGCVGGIMPAVLIPVSPLATRKCITAQSFISTELKIKWGKTSRKFG